MTARRRTRLTRSESQARTRERLLDTAVEVFAERGLAAATVEEIAERAGYSKGAVYSNFASKTDLALAVLERRNEQQLHALATLIPALGDQPDFWVDQATTGSAGPWEPLLAELLVTARYDQHLQARLADQLRRVRTQAARIVAGGSPPGQEHLDAVTVTLALSHGLAAAYSVDPDPHLMHLWAATVTRLYRELTATPPADADADAQQHTDAPGT
jgi:AcrR family transcriptional regulator